ncbi:MAG: glycosyltransferase family 87 protein [Mycobacteriales bacterium]
MLSDHAERRRRAVLWPVAVASFLAVIARSLPGESAYDFTSLYNGASAFLRHSSPYADHGYIFTPGGLLITSPMALLDRQASRITLVAVTAVCAVLAGLVVLKMFNQSWRSSVAAGTLLGLALSETVTYTMVLGNVNTVIALLVALALWSQTCGKQLPAGIAFGLAAALKPIVGPLLLIPLLGRRWLSTVTAAAICLGVNAAGWLLLTDVGRTDYRYYTLPSMTVVRMQFNVSAARVGAYLGAPHLVVLAVRVGIVLLVLAVCYWSLRLPDVAVRLSVQAGALTLGVFLAGSMSEPYWSVALLPLVLSAVRVRSPMHWWTAPLGVYLFATQDAPPDQPWLPPGSGKVFGNLHVAAGWLLLLLTVAAWSFREHRGSRRVATAAPIDAVGDGDDSAREGLMAPCMTAAASPN